MSILNANSLPPAFMYSRSYGTLDSEFRRNDLPYGSPSQSSIATVTNTQSSELDLSPLDGLDSPLNFGRRSTEQESTLLLNNPSLSQVSSRWGNSNRQIEVYLVFFALFVSESSRGIVIPTLVPYIFHLGGTIADVGISVSLFNAGKLLSAAPLGYLAEYLKSTRFALIVAAVLSILANILYATAYLTDQLWVIFLARFLLGMGASIMGIGRGYLAAASNLYPKRESPLAKYISLAGFVQYVGYSLTPIFSAIFAAVDKNSIDGDFESPLTFAFRNLGTVASRGIKLSTFSAAMDFGLPGFVAAQLVPENPTNVPIIDCILPAYFLIFLNAVLIILLLLFMKPFDPVATPESPRTRNRSSSINSNLSDAESIINDENLPAVEESNLKISIDNNALNIAFYVFSIIIFIQRGVVGVVDAVAPAQYQQILGPDHENLASSAGIYFTILGLFGLLTFLILDPLLKVIKINANYILAIGLGFVAVGTLFTIPAIHQSKMWVFTIGIFCIWAVGSPLCQTLTVLIMSELLGSRPQAVVMSYLTNAGNMGRIM
ncbi:hypothetical protein HK098_007035 [Nowakowskiella sp. JEL0407]|nr:hypothetical protein HK098_007035 [Nowakowskiella sp. JEL0407]